MAYHVSQNDSSLILRQSGQAPDLIEGPVPAALSRLDPPFWEGRLQGFLQFRVGLVVPDLKNKLNQMKPIVKLTYRAVVVSVNEISPIWQKIRSFYCLLSIWQFFEPILAIS